MADNTAPCEKSTEARTPDPGEVPAMQEGGAKKNVQRTPDLPSQNNNNAVTPSEPQEPPEPSFVSRTLIIQKEPQSNV